MRTCLRPRPSQAVLPRYTILSLSLHEAISTRRIDLIKNKLSSSFAISVNKWCVHCSYNYYHLYNFESFYLLWAYLL